jgi:zinc transport system substrate-binding protein
MRDFQIFFIIIFTIILASCTGSVPDDNRPVITVSILPQKYLVERVTGDKFRINVLVPPGASAETYEPTPMQVRDLAGSAIYFRIGYMEFERTLISSLQTQNPEVKFVNTADGTNLIAAEIVDHGDHVHHYGVDPHIWLSVPEVMIQAGNILEAVIDKDPENQDLYMNNFSNFMEELVSLHHELTEKFGDLKHRTFLIFHPALGYFARDYGLTQISIEQEGKNPTAANMRKIIDVARETGINDVLIQMEFERENAKTVARELGGEVIEIDPLSENWMDNMTEIAEKLYIVLNKQD